MEAGGSTKLENVIEQALTWNSILHLVCRFWKTFYSINQQTLRDIMRAYGHIECAVIDAEGSSDW